jgi:hypothetical protein
MDIVNGEYIHRGSEKKILLTWHDDVAHSDRELIKVMCMIYGYSLIEPNSKQPYIYIAIASAAIIGAIISHDRTPEIK